MKTNEKAEAAPTVPSAEEAQLIINQLVIHGEPGGDDKGRRPHRNFCFGIN